MPFRSLHIPPGTIRHPLNASSRILLRNGPLTAYLRATQFTSFWNPLFQWPLQVPVWILQLRIPKEFAFFTARKWGILLKELRQNLTLLSSVASPGGILFNWNYPDSMNWNTHTHTRVCVCFFFLTVYWLSVVLVCSEKWDHENTSFNGILILMWKTNFCTFCCLLRIEYLGWTFLSNEFTQSLTLGRFVKVVL